MKKKDLTKLALKGLTAGLLLSAPQLGAAQNMGSHLAQSCGSGGGCGARSSSSQTTSQPSCSANRPTTYQSSCNGNRPPEYQNAPQTSCSANPGNSQANNPYRYKEFTRTISQGCAARPAQQPGTPQGSCSSNGGGRIAASCGSNCSGKSIAEADEVNNAMRETQRKYYDSSDNNNQNRTNTMTPSKSQTAPEGRYLADAQMAAGQKIQTEAELLSHLDAQGKALYQSLSSQGKALAIQLANEDNGSKYANKNMAVKAAAERTNATQKRSGY